MTKTLCTRHVTWTGHIFWHDSAEKCNWKELRNWSYDSLCPRSACTVANLLVHNYRNSHALQETILVSLT